EMTTPETCVACIGIMYAP
ncbi:hypothetical protein D031_1809B, partial [Vibrio parahaemolyticus VP-48]